MATAHKFISNKSNSAKSGLQHLSSNPSLNSGLGDLIKMVLTFGGSKTLDSQISESGGTSSWGRSN